MGIQVTKADVESIVTCEPEAVERVLKMVKDCLADLKSGTKILRAAGSTTLGFGKSAKKQYS